MCAMSVIDRLLRKLTRRDVADAADVSIALPTSLAAGMEAKTFAAVQGEVEALLRIQPEALEALQALARASHWPPLEMKKLAAYGYFYRGELGLAFERAAAHSGGAGAGEAPFDPDMFMLAVISLFHNHQFEDAWRLLAGLGERESFFAGRADYFSIKSSVAFANNRLAVAWQASEEARHLEPDDALIALNAYALAFHLPDMAVFGQLRADIASGRYGTNLNAFALATPILAMDDYVEGFRLFEGRYDQPDAERYVNPALPKERRWRGRAAEWPQGKTLLVTCEQGLGDTIQMARFFDELGELTAGHLIIETQPELLPLLEHAMPSLCFLSRAHGKAPPADYDYWIGSMSLPYLFGTTAGNVPGKAGYLSAPSGNRTYWQERVGDLAGQWPHIGLAWSGSPSHRTDRQRSIPFAQIADWLRERSSFEFFALQTVVPMERPANLHDVSEELITFSDTAGLIEQMDLVITVDTSAVHLAGSLGKPTWLLLPHRYEWRWGHEGEGNAWYDSVKVIRQKQHGDWDNVLNEVFGTRLPAWVHEHGRL